MGPPKIKGRRVKNFVKAKKREIGGEDSKMNEQLAFLGLKVVPVTGDGNCFFRAIADQLHGNEEEHDNFRQKVVDFLLEHKEDFAPFLEEEITFDEYCNKMRQDGTWAGHMELQATSLVTNCDICIHRVDFPRWQIMNFQSPGTPIFQLSYHGEEHYNSVRRMDDTGVGPPVLEIVKADANLVNDLPPAKDGQSDKLKPRRIDSLAIKRVMSGADYFDAVHVKKVLDDVHGDMDAAVEYLVAERTSDESESSDDLISLDDLGTSTERQLGTSFDPHPSETGLLDADMGANENTTGLDIRSTVARTKNALIHPVQAISRNKKCPCGSRKKHKACCGAVQGKRGVTILSSSREGYSSNNSKKEKSSGSSPLEDTPAFKESDLGVLCI